MKTWDSMTDALKDFLNTHPTYASVEFKDAAFGHGTFLHPLLIMSQYIIDSLVEKGEKRIAVILPDDKCSILSLIVGKYFQNLQEDPYYASNIFETIVPGQHVKLMKAVAEFLEIDNENQIIKYKVGKETRQSGPVTITTPITNYHLLLEKTEADVSSYEAWQKALLKIRNRDTHTALSLYLDKFKQKKTGVRKTILILAPKNDMKTQLAELIVNDQPLESIIAYGELTDSRDKPYLLLNKGKLECMPGIAVANKLSQINSFIMRYRPETISSVYCTPDKFQEVIDNLDSFKKTLRAKVPVVLFVPESEFEKYDVLRDLGFVFWQWKPATMKSSCFITEDLDVLERSIFSRLAAKANSAARASCKILRCSSPDLADTKKLLSNLFKTVADDDQDLRKVLLKLNKLHKQISYICFEIDDETYKKLSNDWESVFADWDNIKHRYENLPVSEHIDALLGSVMRLITEADQNTKTATVSEQISSAIDRVCVLLPDEVPGIRNISKREGARYKSTVCYFLRYSDFLKISDRGVFFEKLIVPWFDSSRYIKIKQTYCYNQLIYVLYDFENRWRSAFVRRLDSSFPHEEIKKTASGLRLSAKSINDAPFDSIEMEIGATAPTKDDYDFDRAVLRKAINGSSRSVDLPDSVECIPVILSDETVAYFSSGHEFVDVTEICQRGSYKAEKLTADKLSQGHIIMIRQSGKDLIAEKADELMTKDGKTGLRKNSSVWSIALAKFAEGKTVQEVVDSLEKAGFSCSPTQVRYWINGDIICPNDIRAIETIAKISGDGKLLSDSGKIYAAGSAVQEYHRRAGRWLSDELKTRAEDIARIHSEGKTADTVEGIGEIHLYTVEEVLDKEFISRSKINTMEVYA